MDASEKVIDAEFIDDQPKNNRNERDSVVQVAASTARTFAVGLDRAGLASAADKARTAAEIAESAQEAYQAIKPAMSALDRFVKLLEDKKILKYQVRPPLRRVQ